MHLGDPDQDVVGGLLLLLTRVCSTTGNRNGSPNWIVTRGKRSRFQLRTW